MSKKALAICTVVLLILLVTPITPLAWGTSTSSKTTVKNSTQEISSASPKAKQEIIVKFKPGTSEGKADSIVKSEKDKVKGEIDELDVKKVKVEKNEDISEAIEDYDNNPNVEFAEPNYKRSIMVTPNDSYYGSQWSHSRISSAQGWDVTTGSPNTTIAIVDTGVDYNHTDLAGKVTLGYDFYYNDSDPMDGHGHGTHCAGIASAKTNNSAGVAGVSWGSNILAIKVLSNSGSGYDYQVAQGITYAANNGADVISLSLGGSSYSQTMKNAVDYAYGMGCVIVAAAGNSGGYGVIYPAAYPHVIAVASTTSSDVRSSFSTYGPEVDIAAPGSSILSSLPGNSYSSWSGTSMATPHVAGLAALYLSIEPAASPDVVETRIEETADDLGSAGKDWYYGHGRINVATALGPMMTHAQYITSLYQRILGRQPDAPGLAAWVAALNAGVSRSSVAYSFLCSYERSRNYVTDLYQNVLGRSPDSAGLEGWSWAMVYGLADEVVQACFYGSDEYFLNRISPSTNRQFVTSMYQTFLDRTPLETEKEMWVNAINSGMSRTVVTLAFVNSHEYHTIFVENTYSNVLERSADQAGLDNWVNLMDMGVPQRTVTAYFYGSYEYCASQR